MIACIDNGCAGRASGRGAKSKSTIPYAPGRRRPCIGCRPLMNAPAILNLDIRSPRRRPPAKRRRGAGHPLAAHAAAVRARPHQPVAARGRRRLGPLVDTGLGDDAHARSVGEDSQHDLADGPVKTRGRHALSPRPRRQRRAGWLSASAVELWMTQGEYLRRPSRRAGALTARGAPFSRDERPESRHAAAWRRASNRTRARVPRVPARYRRMIEGEPLAIGGHELAR